jgi:hypothetical protein
METQGQAGLDSIVAEFAGWVKTLGQQAVAMKDDADVLKLEKDLRDGGRAILLQLMQKLMQAAVDAGQEQTRCCPTCRHRRHHQGVRRRKLLSGFGSLTIQGIYWRCHACGTYGHAADALLADSKSPLMRGLVCLLGVALTSFDKAELIAQRLLGVKVDDNTIRRLCHKQGTLAAQQQDAPPTPVTQGEELVGSCDGLFVRTREYNWCEVKAFRFEHSGGRFGGAYLENSGQFVPRMVLATQRLEAQNAGRCLFLSDMAQWITRTVAADLPGWTHIADFWHACQHLFPAGQALYGKEHPRAGKWSRYWCRRLRRHGAAYVRDRLRRLVEHYQSAYRQLAIQAAADFLDRHANRMDYPTYDRNGWTISSGPMESFCKQIGLRMSGPGMRWNQGNVSAMASLVSRWSLDAERCELFGADPCLN